MADDKNEEESGEEVAEKKKPIMLIVIGIVALLLVVAIVVFAMMLGGSEEEEGADSPNKGKQGAKETSLLTVGVMYELDSLTVNLLNENGRRYLKTTINLEMSGEELMPELDMKKAVVRDLIIQILASKQIEEISTLNGKKRLKEELIGAINRRLVDGSVNNVYFTEFVMQ
jgi:flagellar FliL protein